MVWAYRVKHLKGDANVEIQLKHNNRKTVVHANRLKPYFVASKNLPVCPDFLHQPPPSQTFPEDVHPPPPCRRIIHKFNKLCYLTSENSMSINHRSLHPHTCKFRCTHLAADEFLHLLRCNLHLLRRKQISMTHHLPCALAHARAHLLLNSPPRKV